MQVFLAFMCDDLHKLVSGFLLAKLICSGLHVECQHCVAATLDVCKPIYVRTHVYVKTYININVGVLLTCVVLLGGVCGWWHGLYTHIGAGKPGCNVYGMDSMHPSFYLSFCFLGVPQTVTLCMVIVAQPCHGCRSIADGAGAKSRKLRLNEVNSGLAGSGLCRLSA